MKICKLFSAAILSAAITGCLTSTDPAINRWPLEYTGATNPASSAATYGVVRVSQTVVRAPFDGATIAVLRANGTIAFDAYNEFAAAPSQILHGAIFDALNSCGKFSAVIGGASVVKADCSVEILLTHLALDCRKEGERTAQVKLVLRLVKDRGVEKCVYANGAASAADGDYGRAFSQAVSMAINDALNAL